jgi:carotenoid cleavage dioxygenase
LPFLGDGMIHAFFLEPNKDGGRARYRNRWVRTPKWHAENKAGRLLFYGPGTPTDPSAANVNPSPANIHIVYHAGKLMALQSTANCSSSIRRISARRVHEHGGKRTAHPKIDPETGEMVWFAYFAGPERFSNLIDYASLTNPET